MRLKLAVTKGDKEIIKTIIKEYHSYVPTHKSVGRRIDFIIYDNDMYHILGMIGVGSSVYPPPKDILKYIGKTKNEYKEIFNSFANNWRFCLIRRDDGFKIEENLGTRVLKEFRKQCKIEWKRKYGDDLRFLITFVGSGHDGTIYRADNWECIGKTSGLPSHKSTSMKWSTKQQLKDSFVKPSGGDLQKLIFIKEI